MQPDQKYCITLRDASLLTCAICGQGLHNSCVLSQLKTPEADQAYFTLAQVQALINPCHLLGIHYLCGACESNAIPAKDAGPLKKRMTAAFQATVDKDKAE